MSQLRLNQVKPPAWQEPINHQQVKHPVMMLMLDTMSQQRLNQVKPPAWKEPIKHQQVNRLVMMPMQDTMSQQRLNQVKLLVLLEAINQIRGKLLRRRRCRILCPTTAQSSQTACLAGTYQPSTGQTSCDDADAGCYVDQTGQSTQTACLAGKYNPNTGSTSISACVDAGVGYYVDSSLGTGQSTQTSCVKGKSTITTGSTSYLQCLPDHDGDLTVDVLDDDDDNDGVYDIDDSCPRGLSTLVADYDGDGCDDATEDTEMMMVMVFLTSMMIVQTDTHIRTTTEMVVTIGR